MSFTSEELDTLQEQVCECEKEYDPSGAYSIVTAVCLYCQFIDELRNLSVANSELRETLGDLLRDVQISCRYFKIKQGKG